MRLKVSLSREPKHTELCSAVGWSGSDEVFSCADDHQLVRWNLLTGETTVVATLAETLFPTDLHWFPRGIGDKKSGGADLFALASTEGKVYLVSKTGRFEKAVDAHAGAVLAVRWSFDGTSLLTCGEDGAVKIWSRSGMHRATLSQNGVPIYSGCWSPDNSSALFCVGKNLVIKPLQANARVTQWKGHEETILAVDWSSSGDRIVSGGEDCRYKVWNSIGVLLYASGTNDHPVTAISWSPRGNLFAVGGFESLRLCDEAGWSHSIDKPKTGSICKISWSYDNTQIAGACGNGHVVFCNVIESRAEWKHLEAVQTKRKTIEVRNVLEETREVLEVKDRIIKMSLGWNYLVVVAATQCYIYHSSKWTTPTIFDLKEGSVGLIILAAKSFLLVDGGQMYIYGYDGKLVCSPKPPGLLKNLLSEDTVGLSPDTIVLSDKSESKSILMFDSNTGKPLSPGKFTHEHEIVELSIDQCASSVDRKVAFIDTNSDLFVLSTRSSGTTMKLMKLGAMVNHIRFNDMTPMLAGIRDGNLVVWLYPGVAFVDRDLLPKTIFTKESQDFGKNSCLVSFNGNQVTVRRGDGANITAGIPPFAAGLHAYVDKGKWDDGLRLCRHVKDDCLWAVLAATASHAKNVNAAEIAYGAINEAEKVYYLRALKNSNNKDIRNAEISLFCGNIGDAEMTFLQSGNVFRAIFTNILLYRWDKALDLALKHKIHVDTVLAYRQRYLERFNRKETNKRFLDAQRDEDVDWDLVQEKIGAELAKEKSK